MFVQTCQGNSRLGAQSILNINGSKIIIYSWAQS